MLDLVILQPPDRSGHTGCLINTSFFGWYERFPNLFSEKHTGYKTSRSRGEDLRNSQKKHTIWKVYHYRLPNLS